MSFKALLVSIAFAGVALARYVANGEDATIGAENLECKTSEDSWLKELKTKTDAAQNLTVEAKVLYDQMGAIKANQDITNEEENDQIQRLVTELPLKLGKMLFYS
uniref:Secreted protein n=1 Tax=Rhabditophanes sp. KR3021 TaxID=114890 RepID=A0AC35U8X9_9BILA